jgi:hypothetical protein
VLSILWPGLLIDRERPGLLIRCLSDHAATALERAELLRRLNDAARAGRRTCRERTLGHKDRAPRFWIESSRVSLRRALVR